MILTIVKFMGTDGLVRQGAMMCWNQNIADQDTKANTIASDSVAAAPCVLALLILSSLHTRTCLSSIVNTMDADGTETQWFILSFQYQEVVVKIQIYFVFKMNPPQQDMRILCLPCTSINSTDYTCKCILFLNNWFEIFFFFFGGGGGGGAMISIYKY